MNNLFSSSWRKDTGDASIDGDLQMSRSFSSSAAAGANLDKFFDDVEGIKDDLKEIDRLQRSLHASNESLKTLHDASAVRSLRSRMDSDVSLALNKAKLIKLRLESLDRANAANRSAPGCGPGSSTDRTRTSVVSGLRKKLREEMEGFGELRGRVAAEYREVVGRRYYTVTGEAADEATVEALVEGGEGERMFERAVRGQQSSGVIVDVVAEMQERRGAAAELERSLLELQQVFLDMSVLVSAQGEQLDDIEAQVGRASSFVRGGTQQLQVARTHQKSTRKWTCIGISILLLVILIIVLPIVLKK